MSILSQVDKKLNMALILVVEDELKVRDLIVETLNTNHLVLEAANGSTALSFLKKVKPNLTILDLNLNSQPDGLEVGQIIDQMPALIGMPVLVISGWADRLQISEAFVSSGANSFLAKPFTPKQLLKEVDKLLEEQEKKPIWLSKSLVSCGREEMHEVIKALADLDNGPESIEFIKRAIERVEADLV